jgi:hypothetical protein
VPPPAGTQKSPETKAAPLPQLGPFFRPDRTIFCHLKSRLNGACPNLTRSGDSSINHCWHVYFGNVRLDIDPSFENDPDMVSASPGKLASADRSKVVERDEKIYRKKPEFI